MHIKNVFTIFIFLLIFSKTSWTQIPDLPWAKQVGAKKFPTGKKIYYVNQFGAISDTNTIHTVAIQKAIDVCAKNGGGIVAFKPGTYVSGSIFLKSKVHLRIDSGVTILGSQHIKDYPEIDTRIAGIEMKWPAALINIVDAQNVAVTGKGIVNGRGKFCWDMYWDMRRNDYEPKGLRWIVDYDAKRVRTFLTQNAADITLKDITFKNAGFWTVQLLYSTRLTVDGVVIRNNEDGHGPSTDGIDVDSSSWVLIQNCDIDCNDDDFCLKSGRDWDGLRVNRPTEYVVIKKCIARKGGGLLTLGSETSGGIRNVLAYDLEAHKTGQGFHIKSTTTRGGIVENIYLHNIKMDGVRNAFYFTMNWNPAYSNSILPKGYQYDSIPSHWKTLLKKVNPPEKGIPVFRNIYISNIKASGITNHIIYCNGLEASPAQNFNFNNIEISGTKAGSISYANGWHFNNVQLKGADGKNVEMTNSTDIHLNN
ncbi:MAG TPA: glycosyl hydrolase family 28 protein [Niabella sp.]|nr:glycosyl hydrolase family 28 protein [Niabella sp.]HOZ95712.1 glycosyl hydrolase family 28 protein [Niabella sp.]HQW15955.1 glycosyl hydrolase family 28 protein [Niabella sp.]HQX21192.1 glycosyl hydrolase family 28 protein [Niabella sp.]HQX40717.1 glycosyl hydrolase family 28 protein [Niabella sp.]